VADVLFGDYNPGGKLVASFPRTVGQFPVYYNHKNSGRPPLQTELSAMYRDVPPTPLYPFGYGLSYTRFAYANLRLSTAQMPLAGSVTVSADVTNVGERAGDEVAQFYVHDVAADVTRPVKELKGFERISLQPGETKTVSFTLSASDLGFYNQEMKFVTEPGEFQVWVGPNSAEGLESRFAVTA
jgi:beta-glucosidase